MRESSVRIRSRLRWNKRFGTREGKDHTTYFDENLNLGGVDLKIFHTPGHSPESISIYWSDEKLLICGDLIFLGGVGRTDIGGGDVRSLKDSIERISKLDLEYILPGHGEIVWEDVNVDKNFDLVRSLYFSWLKWMTLRVFL